MGYVELPAENCTNGDDEALKGKLKEIFSIFIMVLGVCFVVAVALLDLESGPTDSRIYIQDVYVPTLALDTNQTTPFNASIVVELEFRRHPALFNVLSEHHGEHKLVVFYGHSLSPAAGYRTDAFSMDEHTTVRRIEAAMEAPELPWEEARRAVSGGLMVKLLVEVRRGDRVLPVHVAVDASGHMVSGPIELVFDSIF